MALDLSKLSDEDLQALENHDFANMSDAALRYLSKNAHDVPYKPKADNTTADLAAPAAAAAGLAATPSIAKGVSAVGQAAQTAKQIAQPALQAAGQTVAQYAKNPIGAAIDYGAAHVGLPPPVASSKMMPAMQQTMQNMQDWRQGAGNFAPQGGGSPMPQGTPTPAPQPGQQMPLFNEQGQPASQGAPRPGTAPVAPEGVPAGSAAPKPLVGGPAAQEGSSFLQRIAQEYGQVAGKIGQAASAVAESPIGRIAGTGLRVLGSAPVLGAELLTHSSGLNQGEDEWARQQREKYIQAKLQGTIR